MKINCLVFILWSLSYSLVWLSSQVWLSADEVVRVSLRDDVTYPLRVFAMMKEVSDGTSGDNLLESENIIY